MSTEIMNVTAEVVRNANFVTKLKGLATAHPIGALVVGTGTVALASYGAYKITRSIFGRKSAPVQIKAQVAPAPAPVVTPAPAATEAA